MPLNSVNRMDTDNTKQCNRKSNKIIKIVLPGYGLTLCYEIDAKVKLFYFSNSRQGDLKTCYILLKN